MTMDGSQRNGLARWIPALGCALLGAAYLAGGVKLVGLGGSPYYVIAGAGLVLAALLAALGRRAAVIAYLAVMAGTLAWAFAEVGFEPWLLLPRLWLPATLALLFWLPPVRRSLGGVAGDRLLAWGPPAALAGVLLVLGGALFATRFQPATAPLAAAALQSARTADWRAFGGTGNGERFSPAAQITPENVRGLKMAWQFRTGDGPRPGDPAWAGTTFQTTPLNIDDRLYFCTAHNEVIALEADTGKQVWRHDPMVDTRGVPHLACRGLAYHAGTDPAAKCNERLLMGTVDDRLIALDKQDGSRCPGFGTDGAIDLKVGLGNELPGYHFVTSPPTIIGEVAVVGSFIMDNQSNNSPPGVVRAYDVNTGALRWGWDVVSPKGRAALAPGETWTRNTPNVWSVASADPALGLVYLPTGNTPPDFFGGLRSEEQNRYNSSIVALDANTGDVRWAFQTVHKDVWDYDIGSQPVLVDLPSPQGTVPALIAPTKRGEIFLLDRRTGVPLAEVQEKPVPQGPVIGEVLSPTQPYSVGMPSFAPPTLTEASMWGASSLDQLWCRVHFRQQRYEGEFTPITTTGSIIYPGPFGAIDWGSVSVDPERGVMIVNSAWLPFIHKLIPRAEADAIPILEMNKGGAAMPSHASGLFAQAGVPFAVQTLPFMSPLGIPCHAPPWGQIAAVDLATRKVLWQRPLGTTADHAPLGVPFPVGVFNLGGTVTTRGGLTFVGATIDNYLRAFDVQTGAELWRGRLPAGGQSNPISYVSKRSGKQYVVIAAGGHSSMATTKGDYLMAYALPD